MCIVTFFLSGKIKSLISYFSLSFSFPCIVSKHEVNGQFLSFSIILFSFKRGGMGLNLRMQTNGFYSMLFFTNATLSSSFSFDTHRDSIITPLTMLYILPIFYHLWRFYSELVGENKAICSCFHFLFSSQV